MEKEFEEQKEDKYRDITTAGEDVEGFERFVEEKKGKNYNLWETPEEQRKLEEEFNERKLKRAGEDLKPPEIIPIKGGPTIIEPKDDNRRISGDDVADFKEFLKKEKGIKYDRKYDSIRGDEQLKLEAEFKNSKYYKQDKKDKYDKTVIVKKYYDDDDDDNNDIDDFAAYNMGYRNGKFDRLSTTLYTDISPFDDKDAKTWYKIGYRAGWDSVITKLVSEKIQIK